MIPPGAIAAPTLRQAADRRDLAREGQAGRRGQRRGLDLAGAVMAGGELGNPPRVDVEAHDRHVAR
ncbi:MAG: hypothetical protein ACKORK_06650, partial [Gemmatimonadota bacterium]